VVSSFASAVVKAGSAGVRMESDASKRGSVLSEHAALVVQIERINPRAGG
jgi:hypothetical protein